MSIFILVNSFFVLYAIWGNSLINLSCKGFLILLAYKIIMSKTRTIKKNQETDSKAGSVPTSVNNEEDAMSEKVMKELYLVIYIALNNSI